MNTCKTALRVIWAHKFYLLLYLVGMSLIMIVVGSTNMQAAVRANASSSVGRFEPARAKIAVINRDCGNQAGCELGQGLERYLGRSAQLVTVEDKPQALQDANVSGKSDLIVIIPAGYGQRFLEALEDAATQVHSGDKTHGFPKVETAASYNSSRGSLAQLQVDSYFDAFRTALLTGLGQNGSMDWHSSAAVKDAAAYVVAHCVSDQPRVGIHASPKYDDGALLKGFAMTVGLAAFPLMTALTVCVATLFGAFSSPDRHRRLLASPMRSSSLNGQELIAALILAAISWTYLCVTCCLQHGGIGGVLGFTGLGEGAAEFCRYADIRCFCGIIWIHACSVQPLLFSHKLRGSHLWPSGYVHFRVKFRRPFASGHADHRQTDPRLVVQHCCSINYGFKRSSSGFLGSSADRGCLVRSGLCLCWSHGLTSDAHPGHPGRSCQFRPEYDRVAFLHSYHFQADLSLSNLSTVLFSVIYRI